MIVLSVKNEKILLYKSTSSFSVLLLSIGVIKRLNVQRHLSNVTVDVFCDIPMEDLEKPALPKLKCCNVV